MHIWDKHLIWSWLLLVNTAGFNSIFDMEPIDAYEWLKVVAAIMVHLVVVETGKFAIRRVGSSKSHGKPTKTLNSPTDSVATISVVSDATVPVGAVMIDLSRAP